MVTVTLDTLENTLSLYIKSVLIAELTDPYNGTRSNPFVYKDSPSESLDEFPYVIVESTSGNDIMPSLDSTLMIPRDRVITIRVVSKGSRALEYRDTLTDQIRTILRDQTSKDEDDVTLKQNCINIIDMKTGNADMMNIDGDVLRMKEMTVIVRYSGV